MYPTGYVPPKFYWHPKIHKPDTPLRPIVSSCGSVTYGVAKELAKILKLLVGKSPYHINSTHEFVEQVKHITLAPGEYLSSYDVSALFTSVPVDPALKVIKELLEKRPHPQGKNSTPCRRHHSTIGVLSQKHVLFIPRPVLWTGWGCSYGFPSQPHCGQFKYGGLWAKGSQYCPTLPHSGAGMWMTHLSSKRKFTNRTSYNTSTVLTLPFSLWWITIRRMGPSPSWTPLLNQRLMGNCLPLCTGNLPTLSSTTVGQSPSPLSQV